MVVLIVNNLSIVCCEIDGNDLRLVNWFISNNLIIIGNFNLVN